MASSATAQIRLRFFAEDGPIRKAITGMRNLARASASAAGTFGKGAMSGGAQGRGADGKFTGQGGGFAAHAAHIGMAAQAMSQLKGQIDGAVRGPIDEFAEFGLVMAQVRGRIGEISDADFGRLNAKVRELGASTMFSARQVAQAEFELSGVGLSVDDQIGALPQVLKLAQATQVDMATATGIAVSTMSQFGKGVNELPDVLDTLTVAANASVIEVTDVANTFAYVGSVASKAGVPLAEVAAATALLGNKGIESSKAGTGLRAVMSRLLKPAGAAKKALASLGFTAEQAMQGATDPVEFLVKMQERMVKKGFSDVKQLSFFARVFGEEPASAVASLAGAASEVGEDGKTALEKMRDTMAGRGGSLDRLAAGIESTDAAKIAAYESAVSELRLTLGEGLVPALTDTMKAMKPLLSDVGNWIKANPELTKSLGKFLLTTTAVLGVLAPTALAVSSMTMAVGGFTKIMTGVLFPIKSLGGGLMALQAKMAGTSAGAMTLGASFGTAKAAALSLIGVVGAAFAGWELGKLLDSLIGKVFRLQEGLLSTELGVAAFEMFGDDTQQYTKRQERGLNAADAKADAKARADQKAPAHAVGDDKLSIELSVKDDRIEAKPIIQKSKRRLDLRTQPAVP